MGLRSYKPTSAGRRHGTTLDNNEITRSTPEKSLLRSIKKNGGRNCYGRITAHHRGGGHKRSYRVIDFKRSDKDGIPARVDSIEYDPNRSANIALLVYADGEKRYILAPKGIKVDQVLTSGPDAEPRDGNCMALKDIPIGLVIHAIELTLGRGAQLARSAGTSGRLVAREGEYAVVALPSGEMRRVHVRCRATIGTVGNGDHNRVHLGKAGRKRWLGRRPHVRGSAMNPVAHPMGGGEGRRAGGRRFGHVSPWGKPAKGGRTRKVNAASNKYIIRRRKK